MEMQVHMADGEGWIGQQGELGLNSQVLMLQYISFCGVVLTGPAFDSLCNKSKILRFSSTGGQGLHTYCEVEGRLFNNCASPPNCLLLYLWMVHIYSPLIFYILS